ncbi:MAG: hypothetical protein NT003_02445 [Candidatus Magasanikbacteria bacterium]|nr:hypothetical protein [Candidatus Magasanikbacteria bacterium]
MKTVHKQAIITVISIIALIPIVVFIDSVFEWGFFSSVQCPVGMYYHKFSTNGLVPEKFEYCVNDRAGTIEGPFELNVKLYSTDDYFPFVNVRGTLTQGKINGSVIMTRDKEVLYYSDGPESGHNFPWTYEKRAEDGRVVKSIVCDSLACSFGEGQKAQPWATTRPPFEIKKIKETIEANYPIADRE